MGLPVNHFKQRLRSDEAQIGLWLGLADPCCAELAADTSSDRLLLNGECAPNDLRNLFGQSQAPTPYPGQPVIHPIQGGAVLIKQLLDVGAQTLLVPMVNSVAQTEDLVRAVRYPLVGIHGVGSILARASRRNSVMEYLDHVDEQMYLLVQMESLEDLTSLDAVAAVEGVDGVFIGPADLSATTGHRGNPGHLEMQATAGDVIRCIRTVGKAADILSADKALAQRYLELGCALVAVGVNTSLLIRPLHELAGRFKDGAPAPSASSSVYG